MQHIFTRYHLVVVAIYSVLFLGIVVYAPEVFVYKHISSVQSYILMMCSVFFLLLCVRLHKPASVKVHGSENVFTLIVFIMLFSFLEELFFRGVIQGIFLEGFSPFTAVVTSSAIFGLAHVCNGATSYTLRGLNWPLAQLAFYGGIPLGILFILTESLLLPTVLHVLFLVILKKTEVY